MLSMKVSVILAVYNAENSVGRMIDSLLSQTFKDFEIIIINDGSTDSSGNICDEYALKDNRIRVIHKKNEGVSMARQIGLDSAIGEYIIHADADDYVEPTMLEDLYTKAIDENADVVFCDYFVDTSNGVSVRKQIPPKEPDKALRALFQQLHGSCCNKLAKRACYSNFGVRFPEGLNYCEDLLTWIQLFQHPEIKISYVPKAYYHYADNQSSVTRKGSIAMLNQIRLFTQRMAEYLPRGEKDIEEYIQTLPIAPFQYAFQHKLVSDKESRTEYKRLRKVIWRDAHSIRWKLGYLMIDINCMWLAHRLIKL
jgi:glycosyltransferase involved in cell wall biosynthesis